MNTAVSEDIAFWLAKADRENWKGQHDLPFGRDDLALFLGAAGFIKGAEIGVERGLYSEVLCKANPNIRLTCVDAWAPYPGYRIHVSADKLDGFYSDTIERLKPYDVNIIRAFSIQGANHFQDGSLDFVYIDANHRLEQVIADLAAWSSKVRTGGIISGHDFGRGSVGHVKEAVEAWTSAYAIKPLFVLRGDRSPSWFYVQP